jgi:hypothetical protein
MCDRNRNLIAWLCGRISQHGSLYLGGLLPPFTGDTVIPCPCLRVQLINLMATPSLCKCLNSLVAEKKKKRASNLLPELLSVLKASGDSSLFALYCTMTSGEEVIGS